ncbi:MAG TPA: AAA family ATPase [Orrella sp.]
MKPQQIIDRLVADAVVYGGPDEFVDLTPISKDELESSPISKRAIIPGYLYADVRQRIAPGGVGKTTLALFEMMVAGMGSKLWRYSVPHQVKSVLVTREDSRAILVGRMREIARHNGFTDIEVQRVLNNVLIIDVTGQDLRLTHIDGDVPRPHMDNITRLVEAVRPFKPDWMVFDPAISFGVGEARVNDAEQALVEAARVMVNRLDCCIEYIHHSGKANAREATLDQYSGRGGSALADGSRMVSVLQSVTEADWVAKTGKPLDEGESGMIMAMPKMSYTSPQADVLVLRRGFKFDFIEPAPAKTPEQVVKDDADKVYAFIESEWEKGGRHSKNAIEQSTQIVGLTRVRIRSALDHLIAYRRVRLSDSKKFSKTTHLVPMLAKGHGEVPVNEGVN